jgi:UDP-glucose 4-epimerase
MRQTANPTILVTGGAGYIGSHACKTLAQAAYTPVAYHNLVYDHREAVRWGRAKWVSRSLSVAPFSKSARCCRYG